MSKKSPVDSNNYYLYPEWFEGGNQSQPSTSSYSYPTLEYIWSNAVRLTRTVHSNLQDEIEYLEKNISGSGGSCNCSELQYGIDKNSTKIYYNSVNITSNANKIANLSDIKLSRDGSQPMEGELICNIGLKTDIIKARTQSIIDCQNQLRVYQSLGGDGDSGLWLGSDFSLGAPSINLYPYGSSANGKIFIKTPRSDGIVVPRIEIPGKEDLVNIKIRESHIVPYDDNYQDLGSNSKRWKNIYAVKGNFSGTIVPDAILTNSANISDLDERVDYLEENLSTCNCSALQFGIDSNTTKIANLSSIKLSRDGSQIMTGLLQCETGLKTDTIDSYSGDIVECGNDLKVDGSISGDSVNGLSLKAEEGDNVAMIELSPGSTGRILMSTPTSQGVVLPRLEIPDGTGNVDITISNAHIIPSINNWQDLGNSNKRWKNVYALRGNFSGIIIPDNLIHLGPYSVIVYKDDTGVYAKDASGNIIAQGTADEDDASVIQSAIDQGGFIFIARGKYLIKETLSIKNGLSHTKIYGELGKTTLKAEMGDNLIELGEVGKYNQFIEIGYMVLNGNNTSPIGIKMFRQLSPRLLRLSIAHFTDSGIKIGGYTCHVEIGGCNIYSNSTCGIFAQYSLYEAGGLQPVSIRDSVLHYNPTNIYMHNTMAVITSVAFGPGKYGVSLLNVKGVVLNNCYWEVETCGIRVKQEGGGCYVGIIEPYFGMDVDTKLIKIGSPEIEWIGGYNCISKRGTATFSGDGSTTQFSISHGLVSTPSNIQVTPRSEDASGDFYVTANTSNIYVNYLSAPPSGTNNIKLDWNAKV